MRTGGALRRVATFVPARQPTDWERGRREREERRRQKLAKREQRHREHRNRQDPSRDKEKP